MKRSLQEVVELVVFGLIALLLGTGLLWLVGAVFGLVGTVLGWLAGLLWALLRFVVPVALIAGAVVLLIRAARGRGDSAVTIERPARDRGDGSTVEVATSAATGAAAPNVDAVPPAPAASEEAPTHAPSEDDAPSRDAPAQGSPDDGGEVDADDADRDRRPD